MNFADTNSVNDIALVKFDKPFLFEESGNVAPICLPDTEYEEHKKYSKLRLSI